MTPNSSTHLNSAPTPPTLYPRAGNPDHYSGHNHRAFKHVRSSSDYLRSHFRRVEHLTPSKYLGRNIAEQTGGYTSCVPLSGCTDARDPYSGYFAGLHNNIPDAAGHDTIGGFYNCQILVFTQAIMIENEGPIAAPLRSRELVRGNQW